MSRASQAVPDKPSDLEKFRRILKQAFAALSRKHHPDVQGGSVLRRPS